MNIIGVFTLLDVGDRRPRLKSSGSSNGGDLNQFGWKSVKSAVYHQFSQLAMSRCATAAAKRLVCPTTQFGQQSAAASAGHAEFFIVDVAAFDYLIHAGHQIFVIVARIMILNDVAKILAVGRAPARIWIKHHVAFGRHPLKFVIENVTVSRVRPTMNVQNQWILFVRIEIGRLLQPRLDMFAVKAIVRNLFRLGEIQLGEQLVIDVRQLLGGAPGVARSRTNRSLMRVGVETT